MMQSTITIPTTTESQLGDLSSRWHIGRLHPVPDREPEGWELVDLTSVATLESGHTPSRNNPRYWNGTIPWVSLHDSQALDVPSIDDTAQSVTELGIANSSARLLPEGTVIFSRTATVGKATVLGREMATSQDFANYVCGDRLHNQYLMYLFRFMQPEWKRLMAGSTHNTIYMPVFRVIQILLPPIDEQRAIAAALSDVDELIGALGKLIAKKRAIKLATMQQLLTGKTRLPGFERETGGKNTDAGVIPNDWDVRPIGDLFTFKNGLNKAKQFFGFGTPIVNYMDVFQHSGLLASDLKGRVSLSRQEIKNFDVKKGDVFFTRTSETMEDIGVASVLLEEVADTVFSGFVLRARPKDDSLDLHYRKYCFSSAAIRKQIVSTASYTTRALTNGRLISSALIPIPQKEEQRAIAFVLSDMDAEITAIEQRRDKTKDIKHGMMQSLLTGRVRLVKTEGTS